MAPLKCCVGGCGSTSATHRLYCLPKDDQLRNLWMSHLVPRNSILLGLTKDQLINRRVCEKHFERHQLDRNGRRLQLSYPSLFTEEEIARGEPLPAPGEEVTEHSYCKNRDEVDDEDESMLVIGTAAGGSYLDHPSCSHSDTTKSAVMESLPVVDVLTHRESSNPTPIIATPSSLQHTTLQPEAPSNPTVKDVHHTGNTGRMETTAEVVEFFDSLFDSVNGHPGGAKRGKLRKAVKRNSEHIEFWTDSIKKLKKLQFEDCDSKRAVQAGKPRLVQVPSLAGWVKTLESFVRLTKLLFEKYGVDYFYKNTRRIF